VPFRPRRLRERESSAVDRVEKTSAVFISGIGGSALDPPGSEQKAGILTKVEGQ
jgi:hypothetical protein